MENNEHAIELNERHSELNERHSELNERHSELSKRYSELSERHSELSERHSELSERHSELSEKYIQLENEYSENTIIQSMNDMKMKYDELVESTVSTYKYNILDKKYKKLTRIITCGSVLLEFNIKTLKRMDNNMYYQNTNSNFHKIQTNLITLKTLMDEYEECE
jgi:seryl-tRNA synthetase